MTYMIQRVTDEKFMTNLCEWVDSPKDAVAFIYRSTAENMRDYASQNNHNVKIITNEVQTRNTDRDQRSRDRKPDKPVDNTDREPKKRADSGFSERNAVKGSNRSAQMDLFSSL